MKETLVFVTERLSAARQWFRLQGHVEWAKSFDEAIERCGAILNSTDGKESADLLVERFKAVIHNHATKKTAETWREVYDFMGSLVNEILTLRMKCRDQEGQMGEVGKRLAIWARDPSHIGEFVDEQENA